MALVAKFALALFALALVLAAADDGDSPDLARGNRLYAAGNLAAARSAYEACLQHDGSDPYCLSNLASIALDLAAPADGDEPRRLAERLYRRVVAERGMAAGTVGADAAFNLALLLQGDKRRASTEEACAIYKALVAADDARGAPSRWDAVANLASCTHDLKGAPLRAFALHTRAIVPGILRMGGLPIAKRHFHISGTKGASREILTEPGMGGLPIAKNVKTAREAPSDHLERETRPTFKKLLRKGRFLKNAPHSGRMTLSVDWVKVHESKGGVGVLRAPTQIVVHARLPRSPSFRRSPSRPQPAQTPRVGHSTKCLSRRAARAS